MSVPSLQMRLVCEFIKTQASLNEIKEIRRITELIRDIQFMAINSKMREYYDEIVAKVPIAMPLKIKYGTWITDGSSCYLISDTDSFRLSINASGDHVGISKYNPFCNVLINDGVFGQCFNHANCTSFDSITLDPIAVFQLTYWISSIHPKLFAYFKFLNETHQ
jgi:hypothetical protein